MTLAETPGSDVDAAKLAEHEAVIERGLTAFVGVGNALLAIKAQKLYRQSGYSTFEDYCERRWNIGRRWGNRLVLAATTAEVLARDPEVGPMGPVLPVIERQVRPLTALPTDDDKRAAWTAAVESADGEQPTAKQVEVAAAAVAARATPKESTPVTTFSLDRTAEGRRARVEKMRHLAAGGNTSVQIADAVGMTAQHVRATARAEGIVITADEVVGRGSKSVDPERIIAETADTLEGLAMGLSFINLTAHHRETRLRWLNTLNQSMDELNRFRKELQK